MSTLEKVNAAVLEVLPDVLQEINIPLEDALKIAQKKGEFKEGLKTLFLELWDTRAPGGPFVVTRHSIFMK